MNNKQKKALKAKFSDGLSSSGMMVSTLSEWYDAKHRSPSADEVAFVNSIPVGTCPRCGSENVRKDGRSKKTGLIVRECKDCGKNSGRSPGRFSIRGRYRCPNGSSFWSTYSNSIRWKRRRWTTGTPIPRGDIGFRRSSPCSRGYRKALRFPATFGSTKRISRNGARSPKPGAGSGSAGFRGTNSAC